MWRSKKFIIVAVLAAVMLAGSIGGIALANAENGDDSGPAAKFGGFIDKVCAIYEENTGETINCTALKDAFSQARTEMRDEALGSYLQNLVDEGKITQEQADEYFNWRQARPDVPIKFGFKGHGGFRGMGKMRGFGSPCAPAE